MSLGYQDDRRVSRIHSGSDNTCKRVQKNRIVRTRKNLVAVGNVSVCALDKFIISYAATDKLPAPENGLNCRQ